MGLKKNPYEIYVSWQVFSNMESDWREEKLPANTKLHLKSLSTDINFNLTILNIAV